MTPQRGSRGRGLAAFFATALLLGWPVLRAADSESQKKPVFLYSLYFNAAGENRYAPEGVYSEVLSRLKQDFEVRVSAQPIHLAALSAVRVILIANPNDRAFGTNPPPPHMTQRDVRVLTRFVRQGGGLVIMENQDHHNLEVEDSNRLLQHFGMTATNLFTDAKKLVVPEKAPIIGGLRWAYYSGNLLRLDPTHPAKPLGLVTNDLAQKPIQGTRDQEGVLLATAQLGGGRVVVVTDSGWIANWAFNEQGAGGNAIHGQDNWEIFRRLTRWAARLDR